MLDTLPNDILFVVGSAIVLAFAGAAVLKHLGIPQTLGFMLAGIVLGLFGIANPAVIDNLRIFVPLALGLIGYNIGHELKSEKLAGKMKKLSVIVIFEATVTFLVVSLLTTLFTGQLYMGVLFGALASATAPAATADVVWEHSSKGPLTSSLMFILAADDVIAVILTSEALSYSLIIISSSEMPIIIMILSPILTLLISVIAGIIFGLAFVNFVNRESDRGTLLELELGLVILLIGIGILFEFSEILACMTFGYIVAKNIDNDKEQVPLLLQRIMSPVIMIFFVLVGARMSNILTTGSTIIIVVLTSLVYMIGRTSSKFMGASIGAKIVGAESNIKNYLGTCLFCQAGVALGLSFIIEEKFVSLGGEVAQMGALILGVVALSTMIFVIIGPIFVKYSLTKACELPECGEFATPIDDSFTSNEEQNDTSSDPKSNDNIFQK